MRPESGSEQIEENWNRVPQRNDDAKFISVSFNISHYVMVYASRVLLLFFATEEIFSIISSRWSFQLEQNELELKSFMFL